MLALSGKRLRRRDEIPPSVFLGMTLGLDEASAQSRIQRRKEEI